MNLSERPKLEFCSSSCSASTMPSEKMCRFFAFLLYNYDLGERQAVVLRGEQEAWNEYGGLKYHIRKVNEGIEILEQECNTDEISVTYTDLFTDRKEEAKQLLEDRRKEARQLLERRREEVRQLKEDREKETERRWEELGGKTDLATFLDRVDFKREQ